MQLIRRATQQAYLCRGIHSDLFGKSRTYCRTREALHQRASATDTHQHNLRHCTRGPHGHRQSCVGDERAARPPPPVLSRALGAADAARPRGAVPNRVNRRSAAFVRILPQEPIARKRDSCDMLEAMLDGTRQKAAISKPRFASGIRQAAVVTYVSMSDFESLSAQDQAWIARDEKRWQNAQRIAERNPSVDVDGIYRVLRNLEKTPTERLRAALYHGRLHRPNNR